MRESDLISVADAIAVIDAAPVTPRAARVRLENALGLRLAQDIRADRDYPPFNKSLMDGYAVRGADVRSTPVELRVVGEIAAGQRAASSLREGEAMAIMTGAPMPEGADGVVPVEDTLPLHTGEGRGEGALESQRPLDGPRPLTLTLSQAERGRIRIMRAEGPERFITARGADCASGAVVLRKGTKLEAAQLAVAASVGASTVDGYAKPRVAVLSTGNELVSIDSAAGESQIRNSNNIMLAALLTRMGCDVTDLGIAPDNPQAIRTSIEKGLHFDALFVSGGMSMGQYDFVPKILGELGIELKITKLRIKPGKPFIFGQNGNSTVFGLPGNPVSSFVCTVRLCSRWIARMSGETRLERFKPAKLQSPLEANGAREFYQPALLDYGTVTPLKWKGSADIYTLAMANALIVRPENAPSLQAGASVDVIEIPS